MLVWKSIFLSALTIHRPVLKVAGGAGWRFQERAGVKVYGLFRMGKAYGALGWPQVLTTR